jgi:hypothetical protein
MVKKLTLLAMFVGAIAVFAVPAMASASSLVEGKGNPISTPAQLLGTSTNVKTVTSKGTLTCEKVTVSAEVTKNSGGTVEAKGTSTENKTSGCKLGSEPTTIEGPHLVSLKSTTSESGSASLEFSAFGGLCTFTGSVPVTYSIGTNVLNLSGSLSSAFCGMATFSASVSLETSNKTAVQIE